MPPPKYDNNPEEDDINKIQITNNCYAQFPIFINVDTHRYTSLMIVKYRETNAK